MSSDDRPVAACIFGCGVETARMLEGIGAIGNERAFFAVPICLSCWSLFVASSSPTDGFVAGLPDNGVVAAEIDRQLRAALEEKDHQ